MQRIDVYWRDIPAQVLIKRGRDRGKHLLSHRFQAAIDRAAMKAGKGGSDAYLEEWRRVTTSIEAEGSVNKLKRSILMTISHGSWLRRASMRRPRESGERLVYATRQRAA